MPEVRFEPPLVPARLVQRRKRFLADVVLEDGRQVTAHCVDTGRMSQLLEPGSRVWLTPHDDPRRKLQWTWRIASAGAVLVGVDTSLPNALVAAGAAAGAIAPLAGYRGTRREVRYGRSSRIDVLLEGHPDDPRPCYVEVKNVSLAVAGRALFPDGVTERGRKHLAELSEVVAAGGRSVIFFLVQRSDADRFAPADDIDPAYGAALRAACAAGVEALAWRAAVSPAAVSLDRRIPVEL